jgi:multicomponent Na+:H+ antiporter subunit A
LFLAIGVSVAAGRRLWPVMMPAVVLALSLAGLPLTGGMLAKLAVKAQFSEGVFGTLATLSAVGSALLMLHFLHRLVQATPGDPAPIVATGLIPPWLISAFAALAVPWVLYLTVEKESLHEVLAPGPLWAALWPVLIGGLLAVALWLWGDRVPRVPEGDVVVVGERAVRATVTWGEAIEQADGCLRRWPAASLSLVTFVIILGAVMLAWG